MTAEKWKMALMQCIVQFHVQSSVQIPFAEKIAPMQMPLQLILQNAVQKLVESMAGMSDKLPFVVYLNSDKRQFIGHFRTRN